MSVGVGVWVWVCGGYSQQSCMTCIHKLSNTQYCQSPAELHVVSQLLQWVQESLVQSLQGYVGKLVVQISITMVLLSLLTYWGITDSHPPTIACDCFLEMINSNIITTTSIPSKP